MEYQVRIKEWEAKRWKTIEKFNSFEEAKTFAIRLDMKYRKNFETEFTKIDIKKPNGERFMVADW